MTFKCWTTKSCHLPRKKQLKVRDLIPHEIASDFGCEDEVEPEIISLDSLGVVDVEGVDISRSELMAHALYNAVDKPKGSEDFMVRRGSVFVNEYGRTDSTTGMRNDGGPANPNHLLGAFPVLFPYGQGGFEVE